MSTGGTFNNAEPVQIVTVNEEEHTFRLSEDELTKIILQDNIRNRDVVIVSVAGAFRKGKSFLLDFCLRFLYSRVRNVDSDL
jgi:atlastin